MTIEKEGNHYIAMGDGLSATGRTRFIAISKLFGEILEMKRLFNTFHVPYISR